MCRLIFRSRAMLSLPSRRQLRPTLWVCLRITTCLQSMPRGWQLCPRISSFHDGSEGRELKLCFWRISKKILKNQFLKKIGFFWTHQKLFVWPASSLIWIPFVLAVVNSFKACVVYWKVHFPVVLNSVNLCNHLKFLFGDEDLYYHIHHWREWYESSLVFDCQSC